jgi:hypothetical protein
VSSAVFIDDVIRDRKHSFMMRWNAVDAFARLCGFDVSVVVRGAWCCSSFNRRRSAADAFLKPAGRCLFKYVVVRGIRFFVGVVVGGLFICDGVTGMRQNASEISNVAEELSWGLMVCRRVYFANLALKWGGISMRGDPGGAVLRYVSSTCVAMRGGASVTLVVVVVVVDVVSSLLLVAVVVVSECGVGDVVRSFTRARIL